MAARPNQLIDGWGRAHNNLRISVTDRCNIRCVYCMPEEVRFQPESGPADVRGNRAGRAGCGDAGNRQGATDGRRAAGSPRLAEAGREAGGDRGLDDVGLTTNGMLLAPVAKTLRRAGLKRINVSLDTLDAARFERADAAARGSNR